jgi:hypothetical protein
MSEPLSPPSRPRFAKGPERPQYLQCPDCDRVVMMLLATLSELSALRDRVDTHERLAAAGFDAATGAVEHYEQTPEVRAERASRRTQMIDRVFRILMEERLDPSDPHPTQARPTPDHLDVVDGIATT